MQNKTHLDELIRKAYAPGEAGYEAPDVSEIRARTFIKTDAESRDLFSQLASFLNFRVKLLHAALVFAFIWGGVLLYTDDEVIQVDENPQHPYISTYGAAQNHTTPACIQTFILKK